MVVAFHSWSYLLKSPGDHQSQVLSPETRDRIVCMPGWDRLHDLCLVRGNGWGTGGEHGVPKMIPGR